ncbi:MAG: universal stress protein [Myxococcota bacterium]
MSLFQRILVPVDFSGHAAQALDTAIALAKRFDGSIDVLHSYPIAVGAMTPYGVPFPDTLEKDWRAAAQRTLDAWGEKVSAAGIPVRVHLTSLPASEAAVELAEDEGIDLIVMGTRGLTGLKHVLLGSVAERTLRHAPCAVLTVKADPDDAAA